jgi:hypothetical protein
VIVDLDEAGKVIHAKVGMHSALLDNPDAEAASSKPLSMQ